MNILITGASGFVGGNFLQRFSDKDNLNLLGIARRAMPYNNYQQHDLTQAIKLDFEPDVVVHAAAHVSPWGSKRDYILKNIQATQHVIDFCKQKNCPKLIYISSSSVYYDHSHQFNIREDSEIGPAFINDYSATKYAAEQLVRAYQGQHVILRPRAIFGPGDTVLFPRLLEAAQQGRLPVFKTAQPIVGDLIYIDTLTDYILKAALGTNIKGTYNLTNAKPMPIQALLHDVLDRLAVPIPKKQLDIRVALALATLVEGTYRLLHIKKEPPLTRYGISVLSHSKTFDVSKMLTDLGPPSVSLEEGLKRFVTWQKELMSNV